MITKSSDHLSKNEEDCFISCNLCLLVIIYLQLLLLARTSIYIFLNISKDFKPQKNNLVTKNEIDIKPTNF